MLRPTQQNQAATTLRRSHRSAKRLRDAAAPDTIEKLTAELERYKQRLESSQREFQRVAMTDPLTGCHNRRFFDQIIDREVQRHARYNIPLTSCTEREAGAKSAKLKAGFDLSVQGWALPPGLGLSVGCAELGHAAGNIEALLEEADARMYADKHRRQAPLGPHHVTETGHATGATA